MPCKMYVESYAKKRCHKSALCVYMSNTYVQAYTGCVWAILIISVLI